MYYFNDAYVYECMHVYLSPAEPWGPGGPAIPGGPSIPADPLTPCSPFSPKYKHVMHLH